MSEILIISGKGGTGKTSLTAAFSHLARKHVLCDLDVDAPDLHLLLHPENTVVTEFYSGHEAIIDIEKCDNCGVCSDVCEFDAITHTNVLPTISPLKCEGCKVCVEFCPSDAINFPEKHCGQWYKSDTRFGPMLHAQLIPGEENSGRLVALLRQNAKAFAKEQALDLVLSDGPPGIGCPVISALTGTDLAVIVTEATPSGFHDMARVTDLCHFFKIPVGIIINKCDINQDQTNEINQYCRKNDIELIAELPHDVAVTNAMVKGMTITEFQENGFSDLVKKAWQKIEKMAGTS
ncbi:MAG: ATP-binding protein [Desulfobacterales bacterium]|nr:ATP-binding protein [Desulfobacterales bacterium]